MFGGTVGSGGCSRPAAAEGGEREGGEGEVLASCSHTTRAKPMAEGNSSRSTADAAASSAGSLSSWHRGSPNATAAGASEEMEASWRAVGAQKWCAL